jgi:glycosyltransferase involved in cell wall biosynthesis
MMQKTNFPFEVLIHDDASTDGTADIIREYEKKYPDIIKPIYQTENQHSKGVSISRNFNYPRVQGKYLALCEGDDYWIDENKLQKQVEFLEANEDFSICFHPVNVYNEEERKFIPNTTVPDVPDITDIKTLAKRNFINTLSVVYRCNQKVFDDLNNLPKLPVGDYFLHMLFAKHGKIKKLSDIMAVYRLHKGSTWSSKSIEYTYPIWLKVLVGLIYYFIEDREIRSILIEQYIRFDTSKHYDFIPRDVNLYFDTGNGYSEDKKYQYSFTENKVEISCQVPENTVALRLDPIEGYGCVVSDLEILSYNGIVEYEPINGFTDNNGDIIFVNNDPQIIIRNPSNWLKIKYRILLLSESSHYRVLDNYIATSYNYIATSYERDSLLNSRSWRFTKPLRDIGAFIRRNKIIYLFAKYILSIKKKRNIK